MEVGVGVSRGPETPTVGFHGVGLRGIGTRNSRVTGRGPVSVGHKTRGQTVDLDLTAHPLTLASTRWRGASRTRGWTKETKNYTSRPGGRQGGPGTYTTKVETTRDDTLNVVTTSGPSGATGPSRGIVRPVHTGVGATDVDSWVSGHPDPTGVSSLRLRDPPKRPRHTEETEKTTQPQCDRQTCRTPWVPFTYTLLFPYHPLPVSLSSEDLPLSDCSFRHPRVGSGTPGRIQSVGPRPSGLQSTLSHLSTRCPSRPGIRGHPPTPSSLRHAHRCRSLTCLWDLNGLLTF